MRERLLQWLVCPACGKRPELETFERNGPRVVEGALHCPCGRSYPIINAVPRMLLGELRDDLPRLYPGFFQRRPGLLEKDPALKEALAAPKLDTADRFGYEWGRFADYDCDNFTPFIAPLSAGFLKGKLGLDVGCGAGRHAGRASAEGAEMVAVDLSRAVDSAAVNNADDERVHVVQADVYRLPFRRGIFEFVYSLGVLHHLPAPERGYQALVPLLKPGGALFVWLYAYALRKAALELLRLISQRLPNENIRRMAWLCNLLDYGVFINAFRLARKVPLVGALAGRIAPLRVREYAEYGYQVAYTDWYDRLSAPITNYYREDEMRGWLERSALGNTRLLPEGDSWWWLYGERGGQQ